MHASPVLLVCLAFPLAGCWQPSTDAVDWNSIDYAAITCRNASQPGCKTPDPALNSIGAGKR